MRAGEEQQEKDVVALQKYFVRHLSKLLLLVCCAAASKVLATTYQNANNKQEIPVVCSARHLTVPISDSLFSLSTSTVSVSLC